MRQATSAFNEGRDLDPQNPDWDKEAHQGVMALRLRYVSSAVSLFCWFVFGYPAKIEKHGKLIGS